jgi:hypothetical protein
MSKDLATIQKDNQDKINQLVETLTKLSVEENTNLWDAAVKHLPLLFRQNQIQLDLSCYKPQSNEKSGYKPYLLFTNNSIQDPLTFMVFVFGQNNRTKIHDHKADCITIVLSESIKENSYNKLDGGNFVRKYSNDLGSVIRYKGDLQCDNINDGNNFIHRLKHSKKMDKNLGITMHVYHCLPTVNIENDTICSNSVNNYYQEMVKSDKQKNAVSLCSKL